MALLILGFLTSSPPPFGIMASLGGFERKEMNGERKEKSISQILELIKFRSRNKENKELTETWNMIQPIIYIFVTEVTK